MYPSWPAISNLWRSERQSWPKRRRTGWNSRRGAEDSRRAIDDDEATPRPLRIREAAIEQPELALPLQEGADPEIVDNRVDAASACHHTIVAAPNPRGRNPQLSRDKSSGRRPRCPTGPTARTLRTGRLTLFEQPWVGPHTTPEGERCDDPADRSHLCVRAFQR